MVTLVTYNIHHIHLRELLSGSDLVMEKTEIQPGTYVSQ